MTSKKTALTLALGAAIAAALAAAPVSAADNPFASSFLNKGYMVAEADKAKEGKCGGMMGMKGMDGKHGYEMMDTDKDGKISKDEFMKAHEAMFDKADANKDGFIDSAEMAKMMKEGKCGEGKCGAKSHKEGKCGGKAKAPEGKCGK